MPSYYKQKRDQLVANADSIEVLIMGNSHPMDGVDPGQFSLFAHNLAFGAQTIYFDKRLVEKYLPDLPRLKYVLLNLEYTSLYNDHDKSRDFFYKYYYNINYKDRKFLKESILQSFFVYTPENILSLLIKEQTDLLVKGWMNKTERNDKTVTSLEKNKNRANGFTQTVKNWEGGDSILNDLEELISFIQSHNVMPILITYPNYSLMRSFMDTSLIEQNRNMGNSLSQKYQIPYLYYFDDDDFDVADFFNCDHLNANGAAKLSKKINAVIMDLGK